MIKKIKDTQKNIRNLLEVKLYNLDKGLRSLKYNEDFISFLQAKLKKKRSDSDFLKIIERLSKEWNQLNVLDEKHSNEHFFYEELIKNIDLNCTDQFKKNLVRNKNILPVFRLPFAKKTEDEKIIFNDMYDAVKNYDTNSKLVKYYRKIFRTNDFFSVMIIKNWKNFAEDIFKEVLWLKIYLKFSMNSSLISKITEYLIENYPLKFFSEIRQVILRDYEGFSSKERLSGLGKEFIKRLLVEHKYNSKEVYNLVQNCNFLTKQLQEAFEHYLEINNFDTIFKINKEIFTKTEIINYLFLSKDPNTYVFGKLIRNLDKDRQLLQLIKNAEFVKNNEDYAIFSIDKYHYSLINVGSFFSKDPYEYNWMIFTSGNKNEVNNNYLENMFSKRCINLLLTKKLSNETAS